MLIFQGNSALSSIKLKLKLAQLQEVDSSITELTAQHVFFVEVKESLSDQYNEKLQNVIGTDNKINSVEADVIIVPRLGTISSWSTKATDIAHNSGLGSVKRVERGIAYSLKGMSLRFEDIGHILHDKLTESMIEARDVDSLFDSYEPESFKVVKLKDLNVKNKEMGLALSDQEVEYLVSSYGELGKEPTDTELMMFSVINSEHCRHKIFNASWDIDGKEQSKSLFKMIKNTYEKSGSGVLSAYSDNAAVLEGPSERYFYPDSENRYVYEDDQTNLVIKAETHNHPTAISPRPGAATGVGGEIRDEGATGCGAYSKMGFTGFSVSHLNIADYKLPWERTDTGLDHISTAQQIMLDGPIGSSAYSNEFGRPNLAGYFRSFEYVDEAGDKWGYRKPLMLGGGLGNIKTSMIEKQQLSEGDLLIVLGGPAMKIGLGGGSSSSMETGKSSEDLDFASVQRDNAEMERRAQEVISDCWQLGRNNPIVSIHDVGAGGLSNALPEIVNDCEMGAVVQLRDIPNDEPGMSPMGIWSNEAQERYVIAIKPTSLKDFTAICERERAIFSVVGRATKERSLVVEDSLFKNNPVDVPMSLLFGDGSKMHRSSQTPDSDNEQLDVSSIKLEEAVKRVLSNPTVASKKYLITIGDRTVGGLTVRDQMVGPWQVPVSDVAVTAASFGSVNGEAMAIGERPPLALIDSAAAARVAIGEVITNICAAPIDDLSRVAISANWMAAAGHKDEDYKLFEAVKAVGEEFCPELGVTIPVGKDSLSMRVLQKDSDGSIASPISLVASGFAPVSDTARVLTPELKPEKSDLILIDLGEGKNRLGGSILAQVYSQIGSDSPDISSAVLKNFFNVIQDLNKQGLIQSYHDRSDGGLLAALAEMSFASRQGLEISLDSKTEADVLSELFNEELGVVIQVKRQDPAKVLSIIQSEITEKSRVVAVNIQASEDFVIKNSEGLVVFESTRSDLEKIWARTSFEMQKIRDNPGTAKQEYKLIDKNDKGIISDIKFKVDKKTYKQRPKAAILREQGVNGQVEMAAAFNEAGFDTYDIHMTDLLSGKANLKDFSLLAACGGFSYGDVLGAGSGWAKSILLNEELKQQFKEFFERKDTLTLGVCNGCQMLSQLKEIIPGAANWPSLERNGSEQFEARFVNVKIESSKSAFFKDMEGSIMPIPVAHGEGKMVFAGKANNIAMTYVDGSGQATTSYPLNPNGSLNGATAVTSSDGRATILMPHPERAFLSLQNSYKPDDWGEYAPLMQMFNNARDWFEDNK